MTDDRTRDLEALPKTQVAEDFDPGGDSRSFLGFKSLRGLVALATLILMIRSSVMSPYHVPTPSMEPTIKVGDRLMAFKAAYGFRLPFTDIEIFNYSSPEIGDIVIFKDVKGQNVDYVKRVVALAGDRIEIRDDKITINGVAQDLRLHEHDRSSLVDTTEPDKKTLYQENLGSKSHWITIDKKDNRPLGMSSYPSDPDKSFTVPKESIFVIGDNRDKSTDSRVWGEVPLSYVKGKALFVIWSIFDPGSDGWPSVRWGRTGHWLK